MDTEVIHGLFQRVLAKADHYRDVLQVFGEDSAQAKRAGAVYKASFDEWKREHYWEKFCSTEGPWQPECRVYDC